MAAPSNPAPPLPPGASPSVVSSIRQAAQATKVDFGLLLAQAQQESGLRPDAKASGSTASGLFQFIEQTWLGLVQRFGAKYGEGALAQQIGSAANGQPTVADPAARQRILDLRSDPRLSSALAAEYARLNQDALEQALGRPAANTDVYLAHFLGPGGATTFLKALQHSGNTPAADLLPQAAAANRSVFFDAASGRPRSLAEIYRTFANRLIQDAQVALGGAAPAGGGVPANSAAMVRGLGFDGRTLSQPMTAMLELFAASALRLMDGPLPFFPGPSRRSI